MIQWHKVTWYSWTLAGIIFLVIVPLLTFYFVGQYQEIQNLKLQNINNISIANWETYTNAQYSFTFSYPKNWTLTDNTKNHPSSILPIITVLNLPLSFDLKPTDIQSSIQVFKMSKREAEKYKTDHFNYGWNSVKVNLPQNVYQGEIIASDLKAYPEANTKDCSFAYADIVSLKDGKNVLVFEYTTSQPGWEGVGECSIYNENYVYYRSIFNQLISGIKISS